MTIKFYVHLFSSILVIIKYSNKIKINIWQLKNCFTNLKVHYFCRKHQLKCFKIRYLCLFQISGIAKSLRSIRSKVVLPELIRSANDAMHSSAPIIRPLWMINPLDPVTHTIDDQFLIGDRVRINIALKKISMNFA